MRTPRALLRLSVIATLGIVGALGASPIDASASTTFNVPCGNIKLLEKAVGTPGATVNLAKGCKYQLTDIVVSDYLGPVDELPIVTGSVTINGHGATLLGIPPTSQTCCGRILEVGSPVPGSPSTGYLTLNSVTITQGSYVSVAGGAGGGLAVNLGSTAILNGSVVKNNSTGCNCPGGGGLGGGIENNGTLKLNGSRVFGNTTDGPGGGIWSNGTLSITNHSQVIGNIANKGGGMDAGGTTTLVDSTVIGNRAIDDGGGSSAIGGGIMSGGTLTLVNVTVIGNSVSNPYTFGDNAVGGGIAVFYNSVVVIDHSQIRNNTASVLLPTDAAEGAGLYSNRATVSFVGGAVEFNAATNTGGGTADGGGIFNASGTVTQTGTKVTSNTPDNWS